MKFNKFSFRDAIFSVIIWSCVSIIQISAHQVVLKQGIVEGTTNVSRNGTTFRAFYSIPYAKPPVGHLRFQPPEKAGPWNGVLNATIYPSKDKECIQLERTNTVEGSEDCLHLNVYTPLDSKPGDDIPVIIYIFGGRFIFGNNVQEGPHYVMNKRIILVQPNFRLGPLGYLSTGDDIISGNMGFKDQTMAMRWTRENIGAFGGNPDKITLYGHSTGSISCMFHTFSPLSRGLFKRVIMQSGSALQQNVEITSARARQLAHLVAETLDCNPRNTSQEIRDCFLKKDARDIVDSSKKVALWTDIKEGAYGGVPENPKAREPFMTELPFKSSFPSSEPEWLLGMTQAEAAQVVPLYFENNNEKGTLINNQYNLILPMIIGYYYSTKPNHITFLTRLISTRYLDNKPVSPDIDTRLVKMMTDSLWAFSITEAVKRYKGKRFVYKFNYRANFSTQLNEIDYPRYLGVAHVDDLILVMRHDSSADVLSLQDKLFGDELITRFVNFAYSGNPNTPLPINESILEYWLPVSTDRIEYLSIGQNKSMMKTDYNREEYCFWRATPAYSNFF